MASNAQHPITTNPVVGGGSTTSGDGLPHSATAGTGAGTSSTAGSTSNPTTSSGSKVSEGASDAKGMAAAVHGAGESIRGKFNSAVDKTFNEPSGVAKNDAVAQSGESEMQTGQFSHGTKNREGVVPGDGQRRI